MMVFYVAILMEHLLNPYLSVYKEETEHNVIILDTNSSLDNTMSYHKDVTAPLSIRAWRVSFYQR